MSSRERTGDDRGRTTGSVLSGVVMAVGCVLFLGGFVWGALTYRPYTVPTDSMAPTIGVEDRVLAEQVDGAEVRRGDVVVFRDSVWGDLPMVKRVVGVGGDTVACCSKDGRLTINGKPVEEPYLHAKGPASPTGFSSKVPVGQLFLLGDHRNDSLDSRTHLQDADHGTVSRTAVDARVDARAWPLGSMGMVERPTGFAAMPGGTSQPGPVKIIVGAVILGAVMILGGAAYGPVARRRRRRSG
ncbi:signal peptidase I [Streptomyces rimosus]|uniref:signal peptidase I n=1 Tax=Streptomyces rimosus TaxID=1927 RepID=UPI0005189DC6|nr:signal peptidase I [Streptomyces rimosus]